MINIFAEGRVCSRETGGGSFLAVKSGYLKSTLTCLRVSVLVYSFYSIVLATKNHIRVT